MSSPALGWFSLPAHGTQWPDLYDDEEVAA